MGLGQTNSWSLAAGKAFKQVRGRWLLLGLLPIAAGCASTRERFWEEKQPWVDKMPFIGMPKTPMPPAETVIFRGEDVMDEVPVDPTTAEGKLAGGKELMRQGDYSKAQRVFHRLYENKKNAQPLLEEVRFLEAECLRLQGKYPDAADTYVDLLKRFDRTPFKEASIQHMYDIANYWLDDTREEMKETREWREGKRMIVWPRMVSFSRSKPFLDREGRAIEKLEQVRWNDINGPLADRALFLAGSIKFFHADYREADHYFSQIHERHPNSELAPQAVELAIISKHLSTGGSDYDGRKVAEARNLVHAALQNYPELATKRKDFLDRQIVGITHQQADKDFKIAEFYERTGHPGSAFFYYEVVRRRYPDSNYARRAEDRMAELRRKNKKKEEREQNMTPLEKMIPFEMPVLPGMNPSERGPAPRAIPAGMAPPNASPSGTSQYVP